MSRGPFAYPLLRQLDGDAGGAADLQTDIMRFMAILALCLMAIFALVQSLPEPAATATAPAPAVPTPVPSATPAVEEPQDEPTPVRAESLTRPEARPTPAPEPEQATALTRPRAQPAAPVTTPAEPRPAPAPAPAPPGSDGFSLRFASDLALARLVATGQVGLYAMGEHGARRLSVSGNNLSFWSAPVPNRYHEMDGATVPKAVRDALARSGQDGEVRHWAVTLPARLTGELEALMQRHSGGALVIGGDGSLRREPT